MIDHVTGQRVVVKLHSEFGPYVQVSNYDDAGAMEDELDELSILYFSAPLKGNDLGGAEYFFGIVADPKKVQEVLDKITF